MLNQGRLVLSDMVIAGNAVEGRLGVAGGGGVASEGTLELRRSLVRDNAVRSSEGEAGGGGVHNLGTLLVEASTVTANAGPAGVHNAAGVATVRDSTVVANAGDGIHNDFADLVVGTHERLRQRRTDLSDRRHDRGPGRHALRPGREPRRPAGRHPELDERGGHDAHRRHAELPPDRTGRGDQLGRQSRRRQLVPGRSPGSGHGPADSLSRRPSWRRSGAGSGPARAQAAARKALAPLRITRTGARLRVTVPSAGTLRLTGAGVRTVSRRARAAGAADTEGPDRASHGAHPLDVPARRGRGPGTPADDSHEDKPMGEGSYVRFLRGLILAVGVALSLRGARQRPEPPKVLVLTKTTGTPHASQDAGYAALQAIGAANDMTVERSTDASQFTEDKLAEYAAVVFLSTNGDVLTAEQEAAFQGYIRGGGGFLGIHDAARAGDRLVVVHAADRRAPERGQPDRRPEGDRRDPGPGAPGRQGHADRVGGHRRVVQLGPEPGGQRHVIANLRERSYATLGTGANGWEHPISWCRDYDGGRSFYTGIGHTAASFAERRLPQAPARRAAVGRRPDPRQLQGDDRRQLHRRAPDRAQQLHRHHAREPAQPDRRAARPRGRQQGPRVLHRPRRQGQPAADHQLDRGRTAGAAGAPCTSTTRASPPGSA